MRTIVFQRYIGRTDPTVKGVGRIGWVESVVRAGDEIHADRRPSDHLPQAESMVFDLRPQLTTEVFVERRNDVVSHLVGLLIGQSPLR